MWLQALFVVLTAAAYAHQSLELGVVAELGRVLALLTLAVTGVSGSHCRPDYFAHDRGHVSLILRNLCTILRLLGNVFTEVVGEDGPLLFSPTLLPVKHL